MKTISKKELTEYVNNGKKMDDLCTIYDAKPSQMKALLKEAGLRIKRTVAKKFSLVDDLVPTTDTTTETIN